MEQEEGRETSGRRGVSEDRKYSRVYHDVTGLDPKFDTVYPNDRNLATWLRLLIYHDAVFPALPPIPEGTSRAALTELVRVGLVELCGYRQYQIHGLPAERARRAEAGRAGGVASGLSRRTIVERPLNDSLNDVHRSPGTIVEPAKQSIAKQSIDEHLGALADLPEYLEGRTGRSWSYRPGSRVWDDLEANVRDFGPERVTAVMDAIQIDHPTPAQLVFAADNALHPIPSQKDAERAEREGEERRAHEDRVAATLRRNRELFGDDAA